MDILFAEFRDRSVQRHEVAPPLRPGFSVAEFGPESVVRLNFPGAPRYITHRLVLQLGIPGDHGTVLACRASGWFVRDVAPLHVDSVIRAFRGKRIVVLRTTEEPSMRSLPYPGARIKIIQMNVDPDVLPDSSVVFRPLLLSLAAGEVLDWLRQKADYSWMLLAYLQAARTIRVRSLLLLERNHLIRTYLALQRVLTMLTADSAALFKNYLDVARAVQRDLIAAATILAIHRLPPPVPIPREDDLRSSQDELIKTWKLKAQRGQLVIATVSLLFLLIIEYLKKTK